jgi:hypothetical protein
MKVYDRIPTDAHGGGCLINRRATLLPGERIIDTGLDYDQLPIMNGRLCITEGAVAELMSVVGWVRRTDADDEMRIVAEELRHEVVELRRHLQNVLAAADAVDVMAPSLSDAAELADAGS